MTRRACRCWRLGGLASGTGTALGRTGTSRSAWSPARSWASWVRTARARLRWCARSRPSWCPRPGLFASSGDDAVSDPDSVKPMLGVVPQEANLYWGLTVFHHLRLFGRLQGPVAEGRPRQDEPRHRIAQAPGAQGPAHRGAVGRAQAEGDGGCRCACPPVAHGAG